VRAAPERSRCRTYKARDAGLCLSTSLAISPRPQRKGGNINAAKALRASASIYPA